MPYRDGTGPNGQGPMTGRGIGPCSVNVNNITKKQVGVGKGPVGQGRGQGGLGRGLGPGRGQGLRK